MVKANKKSIEAKAYINGKVNDMREQFVKAPDEEARKQLVKTFRETTSSGEYQEKLKIVHEDTDIVRKYARRKKGEDLTNQEFKDVKTEFYGKDMDLEFGEEFEKLKFGERVNYIFDKFGDTNYAADLITDILNPRKYHILPTNEQLLLKFGERYKTAVLKELLGDDKYHFESGTGDIYNWKNDFYRKFGRGDVALAILKFLLERFDGVCCNYNIKHDMHIMAKDGFYSVSEKTIKSYLESGSDGARGVGEILAKYSAKDGSISDKKIIDLCIKGASYTDSRSFFKKVKVESRKYFVDGLINEGRLKVFLEITKDNKTKFIDDIDFGDGTDVGEYIIDSIFGKYSSQGADGNFLEIVLMLLDIPEYHDKIIDLLCKNIGKIEGLRVQIERSNALNLTEVERAKILGNTEEEDRLNRKKFESDLAKLQELGEKLGIIVKTEEKKQGQSDEVVDEGQVEEELGEEKKTGWRSWFGRKGNKQ